VRRQVDCAQEVKDSKYMEAVFNLGTSADIQGKTV